MASQQSSADRLARLRSWMRDNGKVVIVVPTEDPHGSEYVPAHWKTREWLTGFTGSAGTAVVTQQEAFLWTDSRYWLAAEVQLCGSGFSLKKELVDESMNDWLKERGLTAQYLTEKEIDALWLERPGFPLSQVEIVPTSLAGESAKEKIARLCGWMAQEGRSSCLVSSLAEIAWLLNLRGDDIPYTPVFISYLKVRAEGEHTLYIHREQINAEVEAYLRALNIVTAPYESAPAEEKTETPIPFWRAVKNPVEQAGYREAHIRDGIAMAQFLRRLDGADVTQWTEISADRTLTALRAEQPGFRGLSFETISAYGAHGAVVHYEPTPDTDIPLAPKSFLLLDSGGHYDCGSTDITRTIPLGPLTEEEKRVYTLVLRGHLQLQNVIFPEGTCGLQLDTLARMAMWREGHDYGHGVGHRLEIHEGPCQFRKNVRPDTVAPLHEGQTMTDEPGIYLAGRFGVRHENTMLIRAAEVTAYPGGQGGRFLCFEPLTMCPYDKRPVVKEMLTREELAWFNQYHAKVRETLLPRLQDSKDREWLISATSPL
ncbi:MAG: aminopeptidase P family protein [Bacteroidaceae bacterium]|nr:aminopeptidase P family protein [Bacteroidaceae bacterium]MBR7052243.1 aminopeptidase P family protein [Bacteroidaceae bacterium]